MWDFYIQCVKNQGICVCIFRERWEASHSLIGIYHFKHPFRSSEQQFTKYLGRSSSLEMVPIFYLWKVFLFLLCFLGGRGGGIQLLEYLNKPFSRTKSFKSSFRYRGLNYFTKVYINIVLVY